MTKITVSEQRIREIIKEEVDSVEKKSGLNHEEAVAIASSASKLLSALQSFEEKAPQSAKDAMQSRAPDLKKMLEDMVTNSGAYISRPTPQVKSEPGESGIVDKANVVVAKSDASKKPVLDHAAKLEGINRKIAAKIGKRR